jgi:hypothetical protein
LTTNSVFDEPWWLEALAPGSWSATEISSGGRVVARLPFVRRRRYGLTVLTQPGLTQSLGPWLEPVEGKYVHRLELEKERLTALIDAMPNFDLFQQSFSTAITNWLPFYWKGFAATIRYTYRLDDLTDPDAIWHGFAESTRRQIRKAQKQVVVRDDLPLDVLVELNAATLHRHGVPDPPDERLIRRLDAAATEHGARSLLAAVGGGGELHAAIYIVFDQRTAYYLLGGRSPEFAASGAASLLLWEAIQRARQTSLAFDFEGSMVESIERFFRSFGARQVPYFRVWKARGPARLLLAPRAQ